MTAKKGAAAPKRVAKPAGGPARRPALAVRPLTRARWADFEKLFGERGACAGCWCMFWRLPGKEWKEAGNERNKRAMKRLVAAGRVPGLLAYAGREPIGWCSLAPREEFTRLERSRSLARLDASPVWSVVCFFVARPWRRLGVTQRLLEAAADHARGRGATLLEGYPVDPGKRWPDAYAYTGLLPAFVRAGFREVARPARTRVIVRRGLKPAR
jgi:GNAT superfamily N-acetyltransferase